MFTQVHNLREVPTNVRELLRSSVHPDAGAGGAGKRTAVNTKAAKAAADKASMAQAQMAAAYAGRGSKPPG